MCPRGVSGEMMYLRQKRLKKPRQQMAGQVIRLGHAFGLSSSYRLLHLTSGFSRGAGCCYYVGTYLASYSRRYLHSTYIAGTAVLA